VHPRKGALEVKAEAETHGAGEAEVRAGVQKGAGKDSEGARLDVREQDRDQAELPRLEAKGGTDREGLFEKKPEKKKKKSDKKKPEKKKPAKPKMKKAAQNKLPDEKKTEESSSSESEGSSSSESK
jgi:hypothetical protein